MQRIQIEEEEEITQKQEEIIVGIDLGTTNSLCVYYQNEEEAEILVDICPSVVTFFENGEIEACNINNIVNQKGITISSVKRKIGKEERIKIFNQYYTPEQISAFILKDIILKAEDKLLKKISKAVITVPAYFDDAQRNATKKAAEIANIEVLKILNEPTSAAVFFDVENKEEGIYAVFDLGGGTFDISILQMKMGVLKVIAVGGDANLGGDDFDEILSSHFNCTLYEARKIKEEVCSKGIYNGKFGNLTLDEFDDLILFLVHKLVNIFKETLQEARQKVEDLKGIILVGGSTKMPIIKEAIEYEFKTHIFAGIDPDRIVAFGAAKHAFNIQNKTGNLLLDVIPLTLGIETLGGMVAKIIPRNSLLPIEKTEQLTTGEDNQTGITINIVQGEREFAKDCRSLGSFMLTGLPLMQRGMPKILVSFKVNEEGILSVSAFEKISGIASHIEVRPTYNLNHKDVRKMYEDGMKHGKDDMHKRILEEAKLEAKAIILRAKEYAKVNNTNELISLIQNLENTLNNGTEAEIKSAIDKLRFNPSGFNSSKLVL